MMQQRVLGKTGQLLSVVGFGGIVLTNESPAAAGDIVDEAIERGVNLFDVAPTYGDALELMGPALEPHRAGVFLSCKTVERTRAEAEADLEQSLRALRTDHVDLYQLHGIRSMADAEKAVAPGGALEVLRNAQDAGLTRYIGFSTHSEDAGLFLLQRVPFDCVTFPVNFACWHAGRFGRRLMAEAEKLGVGVIALKALAERRWRDGEERTWPKCWYAPVGSQEDAELALRFTLSKSVTSALSPGHAELLWWACRAAGTITPLSPGDAAALEARSRQLDPVFSAN